MYICTFEQLRSFKYVLDILCSSLGQLYIFCREILVLAFFILLNLISVMHPSFPMFSQIFIWYLERSKNY